MDRRRILAALAAAPLVPLLARAQARPKLVVYIPTAGFARFCQREEGARERTIKWMGEELAARGVIPGRDLVLEWVDLELTDLDAKSLEKRAQALLARSPDLILVGEDGIEGLMRLTKTVPLVFYEFSGDPVVFGLVKSYNHPGGNVTGSTLAAPGAEVKGWELLRALAPKAKRLGVLTRKEELDEPWSIADRDRMKTVATQLGFEFVQIPYPRSPTLAPIERAIRAAKVDVLDASAELEDPWVKDLMAFVQRSRLPTIWANQSRVRAGGLLAVHGSYGEAKVEALAIAARILRGAKPAEIPVAFPKRIITAINLRTAEAMGLPVPPSVVVSANVVVR
jgi:putative ABC transport system substrate-binding protein